MDDSRTELSRVVTHIHNYTRECGVVPSEGSVTGAVAFLCAPTEARTKKNSKTWSSPSGGATFMIDGSESRCADDRWVYAGTKLLMMFIFSLSIISLICHQ